jgi:membrane-bound lytic murein transglycosylase F
MKSVLNRFLLDKLTLLLLLYSLLITGCRNKTTGGNDPVLCNIDLEDIKEAGKIVAVTDYNSTEYFIYRGEPMGYQYDLLNAFANHLDVKLEVIVESDIKQTFEYLNTGKCDLIALNLTITKERSRSINFTLPHSQTRQVLVQRKPENWKMMHPSRIDESLITNPINLAGKQIFVRKNSAYAARLFNLADEIGDTIQIIEVSESDEQLIRLVANNEIDYTVCDENIAMVNQTYYPILDVKTAISFPQNLAWAVRKEGSENLLNDINNWLADYKRTTEFAVIYNKYFKNQKSKERVKSDYFAIGSGKISPYDEHIKRYSDSLGWDWLLLASLIYQESRFDPNVRSWAGAYGLMQLMPSTASRYKVSRNSPPEKNIEAGTNFLKWLDDVFLDKVQDENERIKFVMASYNVGLGHILDARSLARKNDRDPEIWDDNVAYFLLNKSNPEFYRDPVVKYGYCRGEEPYNYVTEILERYDHYRNIIGNTASR